MKSCLSLEMKNTIFKPLGKRLAKYRKLRGLKAYELADLISIKRIQMSRYENGKCDIPLSKVYLLSKALKIPCAELLPDQIEISSLSEDLLNLISYIGEKNLNPGEILEKLKGKEDV